MTSLPQPIATETRDTYIARAMYDATMIHEFPGADDRRGAAETIWGEHCNASGQKQMADRRSAWGAFHHPDNQMEVL